MGKKDKKGASIISYRVLQTKYFPFAIWKCQVSQFGLNYVVHISLEFAHKALKCGAQALSALQLNHIIHLFSITIQ